MRFHFLLLVFLLLTRLVNAQKRIVDGHIYSSEGEILPFATITAYTTDTTKLVAYAISDTTGYYRLEIMPGRYIFKASMMGYQIEYKTLDIYLNRTEDWKLEVDENLLNEVVVRTRLPMGTRKNDTLRYNLKSLLSGKEQNLKEAMDKLPGISFNDSGQLTFRGRPVSELLFNGKPLTEQGHRLVLENIPFDMVESIAVLENFNNPDDLDNTPDVSKTAINITIKNSYHSHLKGNGIFAHGWPDKYHFKVNTYRFGTRSNLYLIAGMNNIKNHILSLKEIMSITGVLENANPNRGVMQTSIPQALSGDKQAKQKTEKLLAGHWVYQPTEKFLLKTRFLGVLNRDIHHMEGVRYYDALPGTPFQTMHSDETRLGFGQYVMKARWNIHPDLLVRYSGIFTWNSNLTNFDENRSGQLFDGKDSAFSVGRLQQIGFQYRKQRHFFTLNGFWRQNMPYRTLHIHSNAPFLDVGFPGGRYIWKQNETQKSVSKGTSFGWRYRLTKQWWGELQWANHQNQSGFYFDIVPQRISDKVERNVSSNHLTARFLFRHKNFKLNGGLQWVWMRIGTERKKWIIPEAYLFWKIDNRHQITLTHNQPWELIPLSYLTDSLYALDVNTRIASRIHDPLTISRIMRSSVHYTWIDMYYGWIFWAGIVWDKGLQGWTHKILPLSTGQEKIYIEGSPPRTRTLFLHADKRWSVLPLTTRFQVISVKKNFYQWSGNDLQHHLYRFNNYSLKVFSRFRGRWNFSAEGKISQNFIRQFSSDLFLWSSSYLAGGSVIFKTDNWDFTAGYSMTHFRQQKNVLNIHHVNILCKFKINKHVSGYLDFSDLLQLGISDQLKTLRNDIYTEQSRVEIMGGYILAGAQMQW